MSCGRLFAESFSIKMVKKWHLLKKHLAWLPALRYSFCMIGRQGNISHTRTGWSSCLKVGTAPLSTEISVLIQLTELCAQNKGTSRVQWKIEQTHSPFKVQSVNKTGYDCHYWKVKYHAHFECMCLLTTVVVDTENKESNVIYSHHKVWKSFVHNTYISQYILRENN